MSDNQWSRAPAPPPPLFFGDKEKDFVSQVNQEIEERILPYQVLYYPIDVERSNFHELYGESIHKSFLPPIMIHAAIVEWNGQETETTGYGIDKRSSITIHFHKRRLTEDLDLFVRTGDFVRYGDFFYEIVGVTEPREMFGQTQSKVEIVAECIRARENTFDAK